MVPLVRPMLSLLLLSMSLSFHPRLEPSHASFLSCLFSLEALEAALEDVLKGCTIKNAHACVL